MSRSKISLLARSVSVLAIGVAAPSVVQAQEGPGIYQSDADVPGTNLYVVPAGTTVYGQEDFDNGGATSTATAIVTCAGNPDADLGDGGDDGAACAGQSGAITQTGNSAVANNTILVVGDQVVHAIASATATIFAANADATIDTGVQQNLGPAVATGTNSLLVTGPGSLTVEANAFAGGVVNIGANVANAEAHIDDGGVLQVAFGASDAHNIIAVEGDINVIVDASATATGIATEDAFASAELDGAGVGQAIFFADTGVNDFTNVNGGNVNVDVNAFASADNVADAFATAEIGVGQYVTASNIAQNNMTNGLGGTIDINIGAQAVGGTAVATANLGVEGGFFNNEGIGQHAEATGTFAFATNVLTNSGAIDMDAVAVANANVGNATAVAHIDTGIWQFASATASLGEAHNTLTNNLGATIGINAQATALANNGGATGGTADADATVGDGIFQSAQADTSATVALVNNGTIDITANALANGDFNASANASIGTGVSQNADGGTVASANLTNGGTLNVVADAHAIAGDAGATALVDGSADATASIDTGIYQDVAATDVAGEATAAITNTGTINITADAEADASGTTQGSAYASADINYGISQIAAASNTSGVADIDLNNTAGTINIHALADAVGSEASAQAHLSTGIYQIASANGTDGQATNDLTNSGTIDIQVSAHADANGTTLHGGSEDAFASAIITTAGIYQTANATGVDGVASANINNSGTINVGVTAAATAASDLADADANIDGWGIYQQATADSATALINNAAGGIIDIAVDARAISGEDASAFASISSSVIHQGAQGSTNAVVAVTNAAGGTIDLSAHAQATAGGTGTAFAGGSADATAYIYAGISQTAGASATDGFASAAINNSGILNVTADAIANAAGTAAGNASADANVDYGLYQYVTASASGGSAIAAINNNGAGAAIDISASAVANGTSATATAIVGGGNGGISQYAYANGTEGDATINLINSGDVNISANAVANVVVNNVTVTSGSATAFASVANGVIQSASANGTDGVALIALNNSGTFNISADASANALDDADASAQIGQGIGQTAQASGTGGNASVSLTNSGTLTIAAAATGNADDNAWVDASIVTGISQVATASGTDGVASANLVNSAGSLSITADASAIGGDDADADATIQWGIFQTVTAAGSGGDASASLVNGAAIDISADAFASGSTGADVTANAQVTHGISQLVYAGGTSGVAEIDLTNSGTLNISADAHAVNLDDDADANATITTGINQSATADGTSGNANVSLVNSVTGSITIAAAATATGSDDADAFVNMDMGISQLATASGTDGIAVIGLTNNGTLTVSADAVADAADDADASAFADGIYQDVSAGGTGGNASITLLNAAGASIDVSANADATGDDAQARADIDTAIWQTADANGTGGVASLSLVNNGSIDITANATAFGFDAAEADATITAINQTASATGVGGVASVFLSNTANTSIDIIANAQATAVSGTASASAQVVTGIHQEVSGNVSADAALLNPGTINIEANAQALADDDVFATAIVSEGIFQSASATAATGVANASMVNSGTLNIVADAQATGDDTATAQASVINAISQLAFGGVSGTAIANIENSGSIDLTADANAVGGDDVHAIASVGGTITHAIYQSASAGTGASAIFTNGGTDGLGTLTLSANAKALSTDGLIGLDADASATAHVNGIAQAVDVADVFTTAVAAPTVGGGFVFEGTLAEGGPALASLTNTGAITMDAIATATADEAAVVHAHVVQVIEQDADGSEATAQILNDGGSLIVNAEANARGSTQANAAAFINGIDQSVTANQIEIDFALDLTAPSEFAFTITDAPSGIALASLTNSGTISMAAVANALGAAVDTLVGGTAAVATATVDGIDQFARGLTATAQVINDGPMSFNATANAGGVDTDPGTPVVTIATTAFANATANGISQVVNADAGAFSLVIPIPGVPPVLATGDVTSTPVGSALASVVNNAAFEVGAVANATAATFASADANAFGVFQNVDGLTATASVVNGDLATFSVDAEAFGSGGTSGRATAVAQGISQFANAVGVDTDFVVSTTVTVPGTTIATTPNVTPLGTANVSVTNTGTMRVEADATAVGTAFANAFATAGGVSQGSTTDPIAGLDWNATFINGPTADFDVHASASASATAGSANAFASATGYELVASGGTLTVDNNSPFNVTAVAVAAGTTGTAFAHAVGIAASAIGTGTPVVFGGTLDGTIDNDAPFTVLASASGPAASSSSADAHGIILDSGVNTLVITNTSVFDVRAITADGGTATSTGILARDNGAGAGPVGGELLTINNDGGSIFAGISIDGGATFQRGMAIDVSTAPNPTLINLLGEGSVYGNIDLAAADNIVVDDGETSFDGIINPEFVGTDTDDLPAGPVFDGTLTITGDGSLFLRDNPAPTNVNYDGPAQVYIGTFTTTGNLALELQTAGPAANVTHYPQIFANTANLDGTLEIVPNNTGIVGPVLYDDILFDNVIEADTRVGTFDSLIFTPPGALVSAEIIYDAANNVDIGIDRTPFGQLGDETPNQAAVGAGIEAVYTPTLTGPFGNLLAEIFTLNAADYYNALDQLSGVEYPLYVHSLRNNTFTNNMFIADQTDCAIDVRGVDACRTPEKGARFWIMGTYDWQKLDGNDNFIGYKANNWAALLGVDYRFGNNFQLGAFAGYRNVDVDFRGSLGSEVDSDGWQVGLTAAYDTGDFYIRGVGSYSMLSGDSERTISIGSGPGLVAGTAVGEPDTNVWSFYGEAGARFDMGGSWITPFVGVDYTSIKLESFVETGVPGANLALDSQRESQFSGLVGLKWTGNFGGIVPEAKVAYRHDFGDRTLGVDLRFADAPVGSDFRKAERYDRGSIIAGLSLAGVISDKVTGRIGYQGRFNDEIKDHAVYGSLTFKFGGPKAPAPEPAPEPLPVTPMPEPIPEPPVAPPTVGPFMVFFDWDKDEITPQAAAILDNAAAAYAQTGQAQVMLAGHADRSGSDQYNVGLSQRRAANVRSYLAGRGVPDGVITSEAFGESRPLVETADGVREPQNRRVEITYGPGSGQ